LCASFFIVAGSVPVRVSRATDMPPEPLHTRIDRLIESAPTFIPASPASDAEFLRRISIDLTAMPPSPNSLREFVADKSPDKRARIVDQLLDSPLFVRQWATFLDVMLMERRPHLNVTARAWQDYLLAAARANRPLNEIIRELLVADGRDPKQRAASRFYLDRAGEPDLITRDVGRIFLGRDLQCAQCHNHPLVKDYQQSDYQGLLAFFAPGYAFPSVPTPNDTVVFPEKAASDLTFDSVFVKGDKHVTGPRVSGEPELDEPTFPPGEEYVVKPTDKTLPVPRYSRRVRLASVLTEGANQAFNENLANRLWAFLMGRGLVHPLDLGHPANPPTQPELLRLLGREIAEMRFNARPFLRQLALTRTYQRSIDLPETLNKLLAVAAANLTKLKSQSSVLEERAEQARSAYQASVKAWHKAEDLLVPLITENQKALAAHAEVSKKAADAQLALKTATSKLDPARNLAKAFTEAAAQAHEAATLVPQEKELQDAAQKFKGRATAATAAITAVEKAILAAKKTLEISQKDIVTAARQVSNTRDKMNPVRETVRKAEQLVIAKRLTMSEARSAAELHARRIELLEACVARKSIEEQTADANRAIAVKRLALAKLNENRSAIIADKSRHEAAMNQAMADIAVEEERSKALRTELTTTNDHLTTLLGNQFALAQLKPLTPEQMCWSVLKITGVYDMTRTAEESALAKSNPLPVATAADPALLRARSAEIEQRTFDKLKGNLPPFISVYSAGAGQPQNDFFATPDQALFTANGGSIAAWVAPTPGHLSYRLLQQPDPRVLADDLYMTVLSRPPTDDEIADVTRILQISTKDKPAAVQELVWGLLASAEFRFNH
jgi:hypothetical protein